MEEGEDLGSLDDGPNHEGGGASQQELPYRTGTAP